MSEWKKMKENSKVRVDKETRKYHTGKYLTKPIYIYTNIINQIALHCAWRNN